MTGATDGAIAQIGRGGIVMITGDPLRDGDMDMVVAGTFADAAAINFLAVHARGLICLALTPQDAIRLGIALLNSGSERQSGRRFGQSIEAREGVTTGISAADRARTVAVALEPASTASHLVSPGHVFPLIARDGAAGRYGAAEAALDLCRLAGLAPAAVLCAVLGEDGGMARAADVAPLTAAHGIPHVSVAEVAARAGAPA